jgi:hypothetical protein
MGGDYKLKVIVLMHEHEKLMAELYSIFAGRFSEDKMLWETLGNDELKHAGTIETLYKQVSEGTVLINEGKSSTLVVQSMVNYTKGLIEKARKGGMTRINALSIGRDLENNLLEKKYFTFFKSSSVQFNDSMEELLIETAKHREMLEIRWETVRQGSL